MKTLRAAVLILIAAFPTLAEAQRRRDGDDQQKAPQGEKPPSQKEKIFPTKVSWVAVALNGKPFSGRERPTFILDEQFRLRGYGGCNTFSATAYPLREQRLAVGPFAMTKKACDKAVMDLERTFLIALRTSMQWDTVSGQLVIRGQNGELKFDRSI